jgi:hypothetical protein
MDRGGQHCRVLSVGGEKSGGRPTILAFALQFLVAMGAEECGDIFFIHD